MKNRRWKLYVLTLLIVGVSVLTAFGNNINDLQNQLQSLDKLQEDMEKQIQENERTQDSIYAQIQVLQQQIEETETEIDRLQKDISATETKIEVTTEALLEAEANIDSKQELLGKRVNVMYKNGTIGYAEVLLSSANFSELLSNLDMVQLIVENDVELLKYLEKQREIIEDRKVELETYKREQVALEAEVKGVKSQLQVSRGQYERKMEELAADKEELEKQVDENNKLADQLTEELRKMQSSTAYIGGELKWPVPGYTRISSSFGNRVHPILRVNKFHTGIDIPAPSGTTVIAAGPGTVRYSGVLGSYGKVVMIDHGGGIITLYAHNSKLVVSEGERVKEEQKIAEVGSTGLSTGPHVHFEVRKDGSYVDPIPYVSGN